MPYLERPGARLFYDVVGEGLETVLTLHGVTMCGAYWSRTGVSAALAESGVRVVDMDLRGHGRSVVIPGEDPGYHVDQVAEDIGAMADHLGLDRFHLLTHATGGMAGLRFAMDHHERLRSLVSTDTGSATAPSDVYSDADYDGEYPPPFAPPFDVPAVTDFARLSVAEQIRQAREGDGRPFWSALDTNEDPERCWRWTEEILAMSNPTHVVQFGRHFYTDLDPQISRLREIQCPNLVILGELDEMFIKPAELLARHLPRVEHLVVPGRGHMLAVEDPEGTAATIASFLQAV